ncbi:MAG: serine/threonine-protein kinase [Planctomycetota bacterium]|jgi:serine/threonine-protein kinase
MPSSPETTPTRLEDEEMRVARAALRRGIIEPEVLQNTLARVQNLREKGVRIRLEKALEEDDVPTLELKAIRKALRPSRRRPRIRGYRILSVAGRGGLGVVYRARQISMERIVALKILPKVLVESRRDLDRFLREAKLAANLTHPNIVGIYEVGRVKDLYFISMEFIPGESLATRVERQGVLPLGRALAMARCVASGLIHAHAKGVIHRDLKPGNIMLRPDGPVKIVDLGLARGMTTLPSERITEIGVLVGTPEFMAPEQARNPKTVDGRADIYALGANLYFALAGIPPFQGKTALEVLAQLFSETPEPLPALRPDLPPGVHEWIRRAMAPRPADRFPDAETAHQALKKLIQALPESERSWHEKFDDTRVSDRRPAIEESASPPRKRLGILLLFAAAGAFAGLLLTSLFFGGTGKRADENAPVVPAVVEPEAVNSIAVERDARAQELFEAAKKYLQDHPEDREGAIRRLKEVIEHYPGTLAAFRAQDGLTALQGREERD